MNHKQDCNCCKCFDKWLAKIVRQAKKAQKKGGKLKWKEFIAIVAENPSSTKQKTFMIS